MKRSLNEVEQTCRKAAKGCGFPWGIADEVGKAVRWLHMFGLDGCGCIARHLSRQDQEGDPDSSPLFGDGVQVATGRLLSPLLAGPGFCDSLADLDGGGIEAGPIAYPLLAAGFIGQAILPPDRSVRVAWQGIEMDLYYQRLQISGRHELLYCDRVPGMKISHSPIQDLNTISRCPLIGDTDIGLNVWTELERYAYRTYVEATDANRLSGAGAGLQDND